MSEEFDLKLDPSLVGAAVREHLIKLQNLFGTFNEMHDNASLTYEKDKILLEEVTEIVAQEVAKHSVIPGSKMKARMYVEVVTKDGMIFTLFKIKNRVVESEDILSRAKSKLTELKNALNVTRSALAWDRHEYSET